MIVFSKQIFAEIIAHLRSALPHEGCGLLGGKDGRVLKNFPTRNSVASPTEYRVDAKEQLNAFRQMREEGLELIGIYHSHPTSKAYPSETDVRLATYDKPFYMVVSLQDIERPEAKLFWVREGKIEEDKFRCEN